MSDAVLIEVHHRTEYRYRHSVELGPHRLLLRPRETRSLQIADFELSIWPAGTIHWADDPLGNAVATASFGSLTDSLVIESRATVRLSAEPWPVYAIDATALRYPFQYDPEVLADLGRLARKPKDEGGRLTAWALDFIASSPTDTLSLLQDLNIGVANAAVYEPRDAEGIQGALETISKRSGSCRDFALLFAEAARSLGFGTRLVSGYLYDPDHCLIGQDEAGSTHAWVETFLPGAGWIPFDPTNRSMGGSNLIPVAVGYGLESVMPVTGGYAGPQNELINMGVAVRVEPRSHNLGTQSEPR